MNNIMENEAFTSTIHVPKQDIKLVVLNEEGGDEHFSLTSQKIPEKRYCTRAVTGCCPFFQEIYNCRTCCSRTDHCIEEETLPLCICFACVDECHSDHDTEYVGMGPCFCDCKDFCCKINDESVNAANRFGFTTTSSTNQVKPPLATIKYLSNSKSTNSYIRDVYTISSLNINRLTKRLVLQSEELVRHSKDTFWLDARIVDTAVQHERDNLCDLEHLAWNIFCQHVQHYISNEELKQGDNRQVAGAEWWVQVKLISSAEEKTILNSINHPSSVEAIDLHYDKDEEMAALFGIGIFPSISTVTYLTEVENAPPTVIFSRRYNEVDDASDPVRIDDIFVSHPRVGKHVAFDGRLLHGAPSHPHLRRQLSQNGEAAFQCGVASNNQSIRITFLVNVWVGHKPVGVNELPVPIRAAIHACTIDNDHRTDASSEYSITFIQDAPVQEIHLKHENDLPKFLRQRIELPFVGGKATWGGEGDDDLKEETESTGGSMVLSTYPPPAHPNSDTILVVFSPDLAPKFEYEED